jgi:hypothetical protein
VPEFVTDGGTIITSSDEYREQIDATMPNSTKSIIQDPRPSRCFLGMFGHGIKPGKKHILLLPHSSKTPEFPKSQVGRHRTLVTTGQPVIKRA